MASCACCSSFSILLHVDRWLSAGKDPRLRPSRVAGPGFRVCFLYSATVPEELVFRDEIEAVAARHPEHIHTTVREQAAAGEEARHHHSRRC